LALFLKEINMDSRLTPEYEKKTLQDMIGQVEDPERTLREQARLRKVNRAVGYTLVLIGFLLAMNSVGHAFIAAVIVFFGGCAIGFGLLLDFVQKQWPIVIQHVNIESMKARLQELDN